MVIHHKKRLVFGGASGIIMIAALVIGCGNFAAKEAQASTTSTEQSQTFTSSGSFNIPNHAVDVRGEVWGGGGAGGCASGHGSTTSRVNVAAGGGGGGGYTSFNWGKVNGNVTVTVGAGGAAVNCGNGGAGGSSSAALSGAGTATANGGGGGGGASKSYSGVSAQWATGAGGSAGGAGNDGGCGWVSGNGTVCGGNGANSGENGAQGGNGGTGQNGGAGGSGYSKSGPGSGAGNDVANGSGGTAPGGGGGGGTVVNSCKALFDDCGTGYGYGGAGAAGRVNIYWKIFTAQASISSVSPNRGFISPASNAADRTVTISGSFADMNLNAFTVYFGTMPAAVISSSNSQIVVSYPETTTPGAVDVKIAYTDSIHGFTDWVTNSVPFTYEDSYLRFDTTETEALSVLFSPSGAAPANGVFAVKSGRKVSTNNPNGYHLSLAPQDGGTDLVCAENNARTIPSVSAAGALDIGDYGYKVDSGDQNGVNSGWNPILADQVVKNVPEPVDGNPVNLWFGMRLDASVPACEAYERVFVMTLAANL